MTPFEKYYLKKKVSFLCGNIKRGNDITDQETVVEKKKNKDLFQNKQ